jgi:hypothetical protein
MDLVVVERKLPGYPGVRALLAIDEQDGRTPARKLKPARVLLVTVGQWFLPAPRKDHAHEHGQ